MRRPPRLACGGLETLFVFRNMSTDFRRPFLVTVVSPPGSAVSATVLPIPTAHGDSSRNKSAGRERAGTKVTPLARRRQSRQRRISAAFRGEADMNRLVRSARLVANDPNATLGLRQILRNYLRPLPNRYSTSISIGPPLSPNSRRTSSRTTRRVSSGSETNACPGDPPPCSNGSK
jgi:hypothetical protein